MRYGLHLPDGHRGRDAAHGACSGCRHGRDVAVGANHEPSAQRQFLRKGHEHRGRELRVQSSIPRVADDADDGAPIAAERSEAQQVARPRDAFADRVLTGKELVGEHLVEDHDSAAAGPIRRGERAPFEQRDGRRAEEIRVGGAKGGTRHCLAHRERFAFCLHLHSNVCAVERQARADAHRDHARQRLDVAPNAVVALLGRCVAGHDALEISASERQELHRYREHFLGPQTGVHIGKPNHGAGQQSRARE